MITPGQEKNRSYYRQLRNQDGRDAVFEFLMQGLMMPCFHAQQCAYATAESRPPEQGRFLNAPFRSLGFPFIDTVQKKRHDIDAGKVD